MITLKGLVCRVVGHKDPLGIMFRGLSIAIIRYMVGPEIRIENRCERCNAYLGPVPRDASLYAR